MFKKRQLGFTIIEVLIVLAIVSLVLLIILIAIPQLREAQRRNQAKTELNSIVVAIGIAQHYYSRPLRLITGNNCSNCACRVPALVTDPGCVNNWQTARNAITAGGYDISTIATDPWGSPYSLDENEGEAGLPACTPDSLRSVGADGIQATSDDITRSVPLRAKPCP